MNWIDVLLVGIVLLSIWSGLRKGFITGTLDLLTWVGSILAGFYFYRQTASFFEEKIPSLGVWTFPLAFILTILIARIILLLLTRSILRVTPEEAHKNSANRLFGVIPGAVNGMINATLIAALLLVLPVSDRLSANARESRIANKLAYQVEWLDGKLSPIFDEAIRRSVSKLTVEPASKESVKLNYTVKYPRVRPDLEAEMLAMVNDERVKMGLHPVKADPELTEVARAHSRDMFARGYFSHVTPEGKTLGQRVKSAKVSFLTAGENLALGPTLSICHQGLMNSPGHKANILHEGFGRLGIGILDGGKYGLMVTQNFRN